MKALVAGTRGSKLALWQSEHIAADLRSRHGVAVRLEIITTRGDVDMREQLQGKLEKGFFTQELEDALRAGRIDFAVHSLKDLPTRDPEGLRIVATPPRAKPHDLLLCRRESLEGPARLKKNARVGASSLRRGALIATHLPGAQAVPLRGNVPTRVERLQKGDFDAIVIARAGVERLQIDLSPFAVFALSPKLWVPAPGQGAIAVQARAADAAFAALAEPLNDAPTARATALERSFLSVLEGGCTTPFGCYVDGDRAWLGQLHGDRWRATSVALPAQASTAFIQRTLADLASAERITSEEEAHEPLFQPLD